MATKLHEMRERRGNLRSVQNYEQGKSPINGAAAETVYRLASALHCAVEDILEIE